MGGDLLSWRMVNPVVATPLPMAPKHSERPLADRRQHFEACAGDFSIA